ncbi:MAG TPA: DUF2285 domain-containing protein [Allosphingosinicella sp.]|nr:DUF2285 domain-containing protein [Allosphingosinicella sp.]
MGRAGPAADWREAAAYAPLLDADRSVFAWEWLRRDPLYRAAAARGGETGASPWGLHRFEDPDLAAPRARPYWSRQRHRLVMLARARPSRMSADAVDLLSLPMAEAFSGCAGSGEHWLLSDGLHSIRLDLEEGSGRHGPVELRYRLVGLQSVKRPLLSLRRLLALVDTGSFSRSLHPSEPKARRWIMALRAHDALAAGMSQRDIAAGLLGGAAGAPRWRIDAASLRSQAQRLVRAARELAGGGWVRFL